MTNLPNDDTSKSKVICNMNNKEKGKEPMKQVPDHTNPTTTSDSTVLYRLASVQQYSVSHHKQQLPPNNGFIQAGTHSRPFSSSAKPCSNIKLIFNSAAGLGSNQLVFIHHQVTTSNSDGMAIQTFAEIFRKKSSTNFRKTYMSNVPSTGR